MTITLPVCGNYYFKGFLAGSTNKYKTVILDDNDGCYPNGFVTLEWVKTDPFEPCRPLNTIVTSSTGDYASMFPVGTKNVPWNIGPLENVDSDTYTWFLSSCDPVKISLTLSDLVDEDDRCV